MLKHILSVYHHCICDVHTMHLFLHPLRTSQHVLAMTVSWSIANFQMKLMLQWVYEEECNQV
jgi:hypothetical protein